MQYRNWTIQFNTDGTFTAINNNDIHDYYIRSTLLLAFDIIEHETNYNPNS